MNRWQKAFMLVSLGIAFGALSGCEDQESDDLAKAQECMDSITSANYPTAASCWQYVAGYDSQQANILKCAIKFLSGGLTTEKITNAYDQINQNVADKEAAFISILALTPSTLATQAQTYCKKTGLKGFIYLSNLSVVASVMVEATNGIGWPNGTPWDPSDPSSVPTQGQIDDMLAACQPPNTCGDPATIGTAIENVAESYCTGENATSDVCAQVNLAIEGSGGDTTLITKQLFCLLDDKTYNPGGDNCL